MRVQQVYNLLQLTACARQTTCSHLYKDHFDIDLMSYEPGSGECRALISSKEQIETMLLSLGKLEGTTEIIRQLREVHLQLEHLHDKRRSAAD